MPKGNLEEWLDHTSKNEYHNRCGLCTSLSLPLVSNTHRTLILRLTMDEFDSTESSKEHHIICSMNAVTKSDYQKSKVLNS
ncbi:hypothetical protein H5410_017534 [Solanum commersonii]|uniref:Uncharacterized protein n=1 Tax=Solanum commersonii TaxID=4109 RepID=A0A9J5ZZC4_SOLCO|nr:hypothetical protein H5410_017534 [Solanum commersonii]